MKKRVEVLMNDELYEQIKNNSGELKMSVSSYICSILHVSELPKRNLPQRSEDTGDDSICIELHGSEASMLRIRANRYGITPTAYIRKQILEKDQNVINVTVSIEDELIKEYVFCKNTVRQILYMLKNSDYSDSFRSELKNLELLLQKLIELTGKYLKDLANTRNRIRQKAYREILRELKRGN